MVSDSSAVDYQEILTRASSIIEKIESKASQSHRKLPWTLRRSRLDNLATQRVAIRAEEAYQALFGEGHRGIVYVTSKVATQEEAHVRMRLGFENWVCSSFPNTESDIFKELEHARANFNKSVCLIGRYCRRVDELFNSQLRLIVTAIEACFDKPEYATALLDFVEHIFNAGMLPIGFESTSEGTSLQVFVCD